MAITEKVIEKLYEEPGIERTYHTCKYYIKKI